MRRHEGWQPNLIRLEQLGDAAQLAQLDYAESWAWVYFMLHSDPERREMLTGYLAELQSHGTAQPFSTRLAEKGVAPEQVLGDFLAGLGQNKTLR
jgi:hypothetical protein